MVETGGPEVVLHGPGQPLVLAGDDTENDAPANAHRASPDGELDAIAQAVAEASEATAPADLPPARSFEDDMDALTLEPGTLVETVALGRGSAMRTLASRIAPRSGERPTGSTRHALAHGPPPEFTCNRDDARHAAMSAPVPR